VTGLVPRRDGPAPDGAARSAPRLRPARATDVARLRRLVDAVLEETFRPIAPRLTARLIAEDFAAEWLSEDWPRLTVAELDGRPVGLVETVDDRLTELWVDTGCRRRGVGGALLAHGEARIAAEGHAVAWLTVLRDNRRARAFYRAHGWRDRDAYPHPRSRVPQIEMARRLTDAPPLPPDAARFLR
jgi:ribosomal protein S18 acetylase RimI-like enzyme